MSKAKIQNSSCELDFHLLHSSLTFHTVVSEYLVLFEQVLDVFATFDPHFSAYRQQSRSISNSPFTLLMRTIINIISNLMPIRRHIIHQFEKLGHRWMLSRIIDVKR